MEKTLLTQLKSEFTYQKNFRKILENKIKKEPVSLQNSRYLRLLSKLSITDQRIKTLNSAIKSATNLKILGRRLFVSFKSKVKLVSMDFEIVLWIDAKNTTQLIGKRVGEIIRLYNSNFRIAGIY